jgi:hypothetical protein
MRVAFTVSGEAYSEHKNALKKLLKAHGLKWLGNLDNVWWGSATERLYAKYDRDEERNMTTAAHLTWDGKAKSAFLNELRAWVSEADGKEDRSPPKTDAKARKQLDLALSFWESITKPDTEQLQETGRPKAWVEKDLDDWKKRREAKRRELRAQLGP